MPAGTQMKLPKTKDPKEFENIVLYCLNTKYSEEKGTDDYFSLYGRQSQKQYGIDLISEDGQIAVQCKNYLSDNQNALIAAIKKDYNSAIDYFNEKNGFPQLECFIAATSFDTDARVLDEVLKLQGTHSCKLKVMFWDHFEQLLIFNDHLLAKFYPDYKHLSFTKLNTVLLRTIKQDMRKHVRFNAGQHDNELFPCGYRVDNQKTEKKIIPLSDYIVESWSEPNHNHIYVEGEGGIGKTVFLLSFGAGEYQGSAKVPAIYVPLYSLTVSSGNDPLEEYIYNRFKSAENTINGPVVSEIDRLANTPWIEHPNLLLLLDGLNEVTDQHVRNELIKSIEGFRAKPGVQIITTSRHIFNSLDGFSMFNIIPLDKEEQIIPFLKRNHIAIPDDSFIWEVINTPLMLQMYIRMGKTKNDFIPSYAPENAGLLLLNFIMLDFDKSLETSRIRKGDYIIALLMAAPYYCWRMIQRADDEYVITESEMKTWLNEYLPLLEEQYKKRVHPWCSLIDDLAAAFELDMDRELFAAAAQKWKTVKRILVNELTLFVNVNDEGEENKYRVIHQNFRDLLAALHIKIAIDIHMQEKADSLPEELLKTNDRYVNRYLGDIIGNHLDEMNKQDEMSWLWNTNKKEGAEVKTTYKILDLIAQHTNHNLEEVDFSGMDLTGINLFRYRIPYTPKLQLSANKKHFVDSKISDHTLAIDGHKAAVSCLSMTDDGKKVVSGSDDCSVKLWDLESGECLLSLDMAHTDDAHIEEITGVIPIENGKYIVSSSYDHTVRMWDAETGECMWCGRHSDSVTCITRIPGSQLIASGGIDGIIKIWNIETGKEIGKQGDLSWSSVTSLSCSGDGSILISGHLDGSANVFEVSDFKWKKTFDIHRDAVKEIAVNYNGTRAATSSSFDERIVCLWDLETLSYIKTLGIKIGAEFSLSICMHNRRETLFTSTIGNCIAEWDIADGNLIKLYEMGREYLTRLRIFPDGEHALVCVNYNAIGLFDFETGQVTIIGNHLGYVVEIAVDKQGKRAISYSWDATMKVWDLENAYCEQTHGNGLNNARETAITKDGKYGITGSLDGSLRIWDLKKHICKHVLSRHHTCIRAIAISENEKTIVTNSIDSTLIAWDSKTGKCQNVSIDNYWLIIAVKISNDGKKIIIGSTDGSVKIWDADSGKEIPTKCFHDAMVLDIAVTDHEIVSCSADSTLKIWDINTGEYIETLKGHTGRVNKVIVNKDGIAVSASVDHTICIWDIPKRKLIRQIPAHSDSIEVLYQTKDKNIFVTGSYDHRVKIWDLNNLDSPIVLKHEIEQKNHLEPIQFAVYDSDRKKVYTADWNRKLKIWDLTDGKARLVETKEFNNARINSCSLAYETGTVLVGTDTGIVLIDGSTTRVIRILPVDIIGADFTGAQFATEELKQAFIDNGAKGIE